MNAFVLAGIIAIVSAVGGYGFGYKHAHDACEAGKVKQIEADGKAKDEKAVKVNTESEKLGAADAKAKVIYRTITRTVDKVVDRPVYRNVCLDADGLSVANAALEGRADTGEPDNPVPRSDGLAGRLGGIGFKKAD